MHLCVGIVAIEMVQYIPGYGMATQRIDGRIPKRIAVCVQVKSMNDCVHIHGNGGATTAVGGSAFATNKVGGGIGG